MHAQCDGEPILVIRNTGDAYLTSSRSTLLHKSVWQLPTASLQVVFIVVSLPFYNNRTNPSPRTGCSADAHTHISAAHAAVAPCENCKCCAHPAAATLAKACAPGLPSPFYQSGPTVSKSCAHAHRHILTFSNYQRRLQDAIVGVRTLKAL